MMKFYSFHCFFSYFVLVNISFCNKMFKFITDLKFSLIILNYPKLQFLNSNQVSRNKNYITNCTLSRKILFLIKIFSSLPFIYITLSHVQLVSNKLIQSNQKNNSSKLLFESNLSFLSKLHNTQFIVQITQSKPKNNISFVPS